VTQIRLVIEAFRSEAGATMADLIGHVRTDPKLAQTLRTGWLQPRRGVAADLLRRAIERGQIRADTDIPVLIDQLYAPLYLRLTMQHEPLDDKLAETLTHTVIDGVRPRD
jgi:tetracycline repressor-like protein